MFISLALLLRFPSRAGCGADADGTATGATVINNGTEVVATDPLVLTGCCGRRGCKGAGVTDMATLPRWFSIVNQMRRFSSEIMFSILSWRSQINA
jgi:hypothetical protein